MGIEIDDGHGVTCVFCSLKVSREFRNSSKLRWNGPFFILRNYNLCVYMTFSTIDRTVLVLHSPMLTSNFV